MELDLTGLGAVLVGFAAVIGSLASGYMAIKNTKRITAIDHAVNGKAPGQETIGEQVDDLHGDRPVPKRTPANGAALRQMVGELVEDMYDRRNKEQEGEI